MANPFIYHFSPRVKHLINHIVVLTCYFLFVLLQYCGCFNKNYYLSHSTEPCFFYYKLFHISFILTYNYNAFCCLIEFIKPFYVNQPVAICGFWGS